MIFRPRGRSTTTSILGVKMAPGNVGIGSYPVSCARARDAIRHRAPQSSIVNRSRQRKRGRKRLRSDDLPGNGQWDGSRQPREMGTDALDQRRDASMESGDGRGSWQPHGRSLRLSFGECRSAEQPPANDLTVRRIKPVGHHARNGNAPVQGARPVVSDRPRAER